MDKLSDLLVDKSLNGLSTAGVSSFGRQFDFHNIVYHIEPRKTALSA